jgi:uncharacterized protein YycO
VIELELQFGDYLLFKGTDILSEAIECITDSKYSHAAFIIDSFHIIEATPAGVKVNPINVSSTMYDVFRVPMTYIQKNRLRDYLYSIIGTPYNFLEDISYLAEKEFGINIPYGKNSVICSQIIYIGIKDKARISDFPKLEGIVKPCDIDIEKFKAK